MAKKKKKYHSRTSIGKFRVATNKEKLALIKLIKSRVPSGYVHDRVAATVMAPPILVSGLRYLLESEEEEIKRMIISSSKSK